MDVIFDRGIYLPTLDLWLDSKRKRPVSVISHAHADHTAAHQQPILTPATAILLRHLLRRSQPRTLEYGEEYNTPQYTLSFHPSGHCLGSAMALVVCKATGQRILYTGDFRMKPNPTAAPLSPVACDVLIMESTYGRQDYVFPPQDKALEQLFDAIRKWMDVGGVPVVLAYRMGKAQELLHHLLSEGFPVAMEEGAHEVTRLHEEAGMRFPKGYRAFDGQVHDDEVLIFPSGRKTREALAGVRNKRFFGMSGWALNGDREHWVGADESFPFSDHADYKEMLAFVADVGAREVYTVYGYPDFARHLSSGGIKAAHLKQGSSTIQLKFA